MLKQATWTVYQSGWLLCIGDGLIFIWPARLLQQRKWGCRDLRHPHKYAINSGEGLRGRGRREVRRRRREVRRDCWPLHGRR